MPDFFGSRFDACVMGVGEALHVLDDAGSMVLQKDGAADDMRSQFRLFPLVAIDGDRAEFIDPHRAAPSFRGDSSAPDIHAKVELVAFNAGDLPTAEFSRATLRLDVGEGASALPGGSALNWAIVAGLNLAAAGTDRPDRAGHDFNGCFARRPIEIRGGAALLRFEVVAHPEPSWWRRIFSRLAKGDVGELVTAFGFPAIVPQAVRILDTAFSQFDAGTTLFRSAKMPFALTESARDGMTMDTPGIEVASLPQGLSLLVPQQHFANVVEVSPKYWMGYGALHPGGATAAEINDSEYVNPLAQIPYAILRTRLEAVKLSGQF